MIRRPYYTASIKGITILSVPHGPYPLDLTRLAGVPMSVGPFTSRRKP